MPYTISLPTQVSSIACYQALIEDLELEITEDPDCFWLRYQKRFNFLFSDIQKLSKQANKHNEKEVADLTARFTELKNGFEQKCVDMLGIRVSNFTQGILQRDDFFLRTYYDWINADIQNCKREMRLLFTYLPSTQKGNLAVIQVTFSQLIERVDKRLINYQMKLGSWSPPLFVQSYESQRYFSFNAQYMTTRLVGNQLVDLAHDIEIDPDCCFSRYSGRVDALRSTLDQKTIYDSIVYKEDVAYLRRRLARVQMNLERRCIVVVDQRLSGEVDRSTLRQMKGRIHNLFLHAFDKTRVNQLCMKWYQVKKNVDTLKVKTPVSRLGQTICRSTTPPNSPKLPQPEVESVQTIRMILRQLRFLTSLEGCGQIKTALEEEKTFQFFVFFAMTRETMSIYQRIFFHTRSKVNVDDLRCAIERTFIELTILSFMITVGKKGPEAAINEYQNIFKAMGVSDQFWDYYLSFYTVRPEDIAACDAARSVLAFLKAEWQTPFQPLSVKEDEKSRTGSLKPGSKDDR